MSQRVKEYQNKKKKILYMVLLRIGTDSEIPKDKFKLLLSVFQWNQLQNRQKRNEITDTVFSSTQTDKRIV